MDIRAGRAGCPLSQMHVLNVSFHSSAKVDAQRYGLATTYCKRKHSPFQGHTLTGGDQLNTSWPHRFFHYDQQPKTKDPGLVVE